MQTPAPAAAEIEPGTATVAPQPEATLAIEAHHATLDRLLDAVTKGSDRSLSVDPALSYRRLHVFFTRRSVEQFQQDVAWITGGRWTEVHGGQRLVATETLRERIERLRRGDPDSEPPAADFQRRLRIAADLAKAAQDRRLLEHLRKADPAMAQQLSDPLTRLVLSGIGTLQLYQGLLLTGRYGLRLPREAIDPGFQSRILDIVRNENSHADRIRAIQLQMRSDGAFILAVDVAASPEIGGNAIFVRVIRPHSAPQPAKAIGGTRSAENNRSEPARQRDSAGEPVVEPSRILVRDPAGALPYRFVESLRNLARAYRLNLAADIQFRRPRVGVVSEERRQAYRKLLEPTLPLMDFLQSLAAVFGYEYQYRHGLHYLRNPRWYWEKKYAHTDSELARVLQIPADRRGKFEVLSTMLGFSTPKAEGLAVLFPAVGRIADARPEIEFFASLATDQRERLAAGREALSIRELSPLQQQLFWKILGVDPRRVPVDARAAYTVELVRQKDGEHLIYDVAGDAPR